MHGMHARLPKNFVLEERLERYRDQIELEPTWWRGRWAETAAAIGAQPFSSVRVDVGCGKGRVLAYLVMHDYKCSITGIEINETSGKIAEKWTANYPQIKLMIGDAFKLNYNDYTVLFLGRPFLPVTFLEFIELIESQLDHPIQLIYWVDQQSGHLLKDRKGWTLVWREKIERINGFRVAPYPQGCSLWKYTPETDTTVKGTK